MKDAKELAEAMLFVLPSGEAEAFIRRVQADAIEAAALRAESEEELDGQPDEQTQQAIRENIVHYGRAVVRSTKRCIADGIRALKPKE